MLSYNSNHLPWFALYVKPRHEKHVALTLQSKGFEAFLPTYSKYHRRDRIFDLPLFPSYVFSRIDVSKTLPILSTPGVFSIVGSGHAPEAISEDEIQGVRRMVEAGLTPVQWPYVSPGQEVSLESGPLQGVQGVIVDASNEKWLVVSVHLLRRSVAVKIDRASLRLKVISESSAKSRALRLSENNSHTY